MRELVRHRAKLVGLRSHCKAEIHAVLAKCGVQVLMSDLFGLAGTADQLGHAQPSVTQNVYMGRKIASTQAATVLQQLA